MNHIDTMKQVRNALHDVTRLIEHQYTGTRRGMSALQRASDACYDALPGLNDLIAQAEKREPVGVMMVRVQPNGTKVCEPEFYEGKTPQAHELLYTAPPQRQPLIPEALQVIDDLYDWRTTEGRMKAYRAIECAHGIGGEA